MASKEKISAGGLSKFRSFIQVSSLIRQPKVRILKLMQWDNVHKGWFWSHGNKFKQILLLFLRD